jgi:prepilin signal peptidase PulO-like enzyme (type II secretory pathway)
MTPSTFFEVLRTLPPPLLVVLGVLAGLALLSTIGVTQWLVLRCHVEGAGVWVAANVLGWLAGLVVVFVAIGAARPARQCSSWRSASLAGLAWA